jgi:hypothetical protein
MPRPRLVKSTDLEIAVVYHGSIEQFYVPKERLDIRIWFRVAYPIIVESNLSNYW